MFRLAELFVSIRAKDEELTKQLGVVKGNLATAAVAMGTAIGSGVAGIVTKAAELTFDFVKETIKGSEELSESWAGLTGTFQGLVSSITGVPGEVGKQLAEMFTPVISQGIEFAQQVIGAVTDIVTQTKPWIDAIKTNLTGMVAGAQPYVEAFGAGVAAAFVNIGVAISAGVEHFERVKATWSAVAESATASFSQITTSIAQAFGSSQVQTLAAWGQAAKEYVGDTIELIGMLVRNWPDFFDIAAIQINQKITDIGSYFQALVANAGQVGDYLANNWRELIIDALDAVATGFQNLGANIGRLAVSIKDFFAGKGWNFDFKPLLDGFKSTADKFPELIKPSFTDVSSAAIAELQAKIADQEANVKPFEFKKREKEKVAEEVAAKQAEGKDAFKSQTFGAADLHSRLQAGILSKEGDAHRSNRSSCWRRSRSRMTTSQSRPSAPSRRCSDETGRRRADQVQG